MANYRPVSVLACLSNVLENTLADQMNPPLEKNLFKISLSISREFRIPFCFITFVHITEMWKKALDDRKYVGILMSDLSKAFDCLPHDVLIEKK